MRYLAIRPMGFNELMRATGLRRSVLHRNLDALADAGRAWREEMPDGRRTWHFGACTLYKGGARRDYSIQREEIAPGHTVVRFGEKWRAGHGQRSHATPARANALGNIYA